MTIDYTIFYKDSFNEVAELSALHNWDIFISAYNTTQRVQSVYAGIRSAEKHWIIHSEYRFDTSDLPNDAHVFSAATIIREDDFIQEFLRTMPGLKGATVCIDISGFMRPHLMFFLRLLRSQGIIQFDVLYSEPERYTRHEQTEFAHGDVTHVRPVSGFEGLHHPSLSPDEDLLIIAAGYEHDLIRHVANAKNNTRKIQLLGFPPLQADFYQENRLNAYRAAEAVSAVNENRPLFAPANDPFVTASVLHDVVEEQRRRDVKNIYICPISSQPQALGVALYHIYEAENQPISVIYPFAERYAQETAIGLSRIWKYHIELG